MKHAQCLPLLLTVACAATTPGEVGSGAPPAYQYADVFQVRRDDAGAGDNWVGYGISGSLRVDDHLRLFGEFRSVVNDNSPGDDIDVLAAGFGYHLPLATHTDLVLDLGFLDEENEKTGDSWSSTVLQVGLHVRTRVLGPLELEAGMTHHDYAESDIDLDLGAIYHLTEQFGLAVHLTDGNRRSALRFGVRLHL